MNGKANVVHFIYYKRLHIIEYSYRPDLEISD